MTTQNPPPPDQKRQLQIQLDDAVAQGAYVNFTLVNHTETEFVLDFVYVQPMEPRAKVRARILSSPKHAKRLMLLLKDHVAHFEEAYGVIDVGNSKDMPVH
jgi:hypothetical protein